MLGRNIDFFAVSLIALAMLGFAEVRTWQFPALDSIRVERAIDIDRCPISSQVLSNILAQFH
jgi:hypothetical protein